MSFDEILAICLEKIERGDSIESCLQQYPDERAELAPLLRLASVLTNSPAPQMSAHAFASGRMRMFEAANNQFNPELYDETQQFYTNGYKGHSYQGHSYQNGDAAPARRDLSQPDCCCEPTPHTLTTTIWLA